MSPLKFLLILLQIYCTIGKYNPTYQFYGHYYNAIHSPRNIQVPGHLRNSEKAGYCNPFQFVCKQQFNVVRTAMFECYSDHQCPKDFKCCWQQCFQHKICQPFTPIRTGDLRSTTEKLVATAQETTTEEPTTTEATTTTEEPTTTTESTTTTEETTTEVASTTEEETTTTEESTTTEETTTEESTTTEETTTEESTTIEETTTEESPTLEESTTTTTEEPPDSTEEEMPSTVEEDVYLDNFIK